MVVVVVVWVVVVVVVLKVIRVEVVVIIEIVLVVKEVVIVVVGMSNSSGGGIEEIDINRLVAAAGIFLLPRVRRLPSHLFPIQILQYGDYQAYYVVVVMSNSCDGGIKKN